jgi:hypothetical protein
MIASHYELTKGSHPGASSSVRKGLGRPSWSSKWPRVILVDIESFVPEVGVPFLMFVELGVFDASGSVSCSQDRLTPLPRTHVGNILIERFMAY